MMEQVTPHLVREWLESDTVLLYRLSTVTLPILIHWSEDLAQILRSWQKPEPLRLVYDLSHPGVSMPYLVLTNRNLFSIGFTDYWRKQCATVFEELPMLRIRLAVVLSSSSSGELARKYNREDRNPRIVTKAFIDTKTAMDWVNAADSFAVPTMTTKQLDEQQIRQIVASYEPVTTTVYHDTEEVVLFINDAVERLKLDAEHSAILGRATLDMTPFGDQSKGVSRRHARLHVSTGFLYLTDLHSTNGTYINGERLRPGEAVIVNRNDEIRLGELTLQVLFK